MQQRVSQPSSLRENKHLIYLQNFLLFLGIHEQFIDVVFNDITGEFMYTIYGDSVAELNDIQEFISNNSSTFIESVNEHLQEENENGEPLLMLEEIEISNEITASIDITVDVTDSTERPFVNDASEDVFSKIFLLFKNVLTYTQQNM